MPTNPEKPQSETTASESGDGTSTTVSLQENSTMEPQKQLPLAAKLPFQPPINFRPGYGPVQPQFYGQPLYVPYYVAYPFINEAKYKVSKKEKKPKKTKEETKKPKKKKQTNPDEELYCYCQKPYDPNRFYIACDHCDEWFHGSCTGVKEADSPGLHLWYCRTCRKKHGCQVVWRKRCALTGCRNFLPEFSTSNHQTPEPTEEKVQPPMASVQTLQKLNVSPKKALSGPTPGYFPYGYPPNMYHSQTLSSTSESKDSPSQSQVPKVAVQPNELPPIKVKEEKLSPQANEKEEIRSSDTEPESAKVQKSEESAPSPTVKTKYCSTGCLELAAKLNLQKHLPLLLPPNVKPIVISTMTSQSEAINLSLPLNQVSGMERQEQADLAEFEKLQKKRQALKERIQQLDQQIRAVDHCIYQSQLLNYDIKTEGVHAQGQRLVQSVCGFDHRLLEMIEKDTVPELLDYSQSLSFLCLEPKRCQRHEGWEVIRLAYIKQKMSNLLVERESLKEQQAKLKEQILKRRLQCLEWSSTAKEKSSTLSLTTFQTPIYI